MKAFSKPFLPLVLLVLSAPLVSTAAGPSDATAQVQAEIESLQQLVKNNPFADPDFPDVGKMLTEGLQSASSALKAGRLYLSLEELGRQSDLLYGVRAVTANKAEVVKGGMPAFDDTWNKASLQLTKLEQQAKADDWSNKPLVLRALAEAAQARTIPLMEGSRGFATATGPKDGLFYLGQAQGEAEFAQFCASLNLSRKGAPIPLRSFLPELQTLQDKTNAAFQPPLSIDQHPRFIALNSTIKLADELDASRSYAGALYIYLEAVRHYGMLTEPPVGAAQQAKLKDALAGLRQKLEGSPQDDSIAQAFVQRAEAYLSHADGSAPSADEFRSARIILEQVIPAYYAAQKPASPLQRASGKTVDITLVRWPYT